MGQASSLRAVPAGDAARAFAVLAGLDPAGQQTPEGAARAGQCFELSTAVGRVVYAVEFSERVAWVHGAAGTGRGMTAAGLAMIEAQAITHGCRHVGFQTLRRGLVRRALRLGYRITSNVGSGFVLVKQIP